MFIQGFKLISLLIIVALALTSCGPADVELDQGPNLKQLPETTARAKEVQNKLSDLDQKEIEKRKAELVLRSPSKALSSSLPTTSDLSIGLDTHQSFSFGSREPFVENWAHLNNSKYFILSGDNLSVRSIAEKIQQLKKAQPLGDAALHISSDADQRNISFDRDIYIYAKTFKLEEGSRISTNGFNLTIIALQLTLDGKISSLSPDATSADSKTSGGNLILIADQIFTSPSAEIDVSANSPLQTVKFHHLSKEEQLRIQDQVFGEKIKQLQHSTQLDPTARIPHLSTSDPRMDPSGIKVVTYPIVFGDLLAQHYSDPEVRIRRYGISGNHEMGPKEISDEFDHKVHNAHRFVVDNGDLTMMESTTAGEAERFRLKVSAVREGIFPRSDADLQWESPPLSIYRRIQNFDSEVKPGSVTFIAPTSYSTDIATRAASIDSNSIVKAQVKLTYSSYIKIENASRIRYQSIFISSAQPLKNPSEAAIEILEDQKFLLVPSKTNLKPVTIAADDFTMIELQQQYPRKALSSEFSQAWIKANQHLKDLKLPGYSSDVEPFATFERKAKAEVIFRQ